MNNIPTPRDLEIASIYQSMIETRIFEFSKKYMGLPCYDDIMLAIEFGFHLENEIDKSFKELELI